MKSGDTKFNIRNTTKDKIPKVTFELIKVSILGVNYDLSLVFCGEKLVRTLNRIHRDKDKPTDILSFPLSKNEGEIFMCIPVAKREYKKYGRTFDNFVAFLFIHGLVHLKGLDHGSKMESEEKKARKRFGI